MKNYDYLEDAELEAKITVKGERIHLERKGNDGGLLVAAFTIVNYLAKRNKKRVSRGPDLVNEHVDRCGGNKRMTGIIVAAIAGFILGALVYYVIGFDNGYAKGRKDERHDHWRYIKNAP